ncbi:hypothetical protein ACFSX5_01040 [Devosia albogilva]|uniref:Uncharacterized protein n=1 Tax=Devosia albogilva TaxID=429726 RepID=A0ABW5QGB5_9HYPH
MINRIWLAIVRFRTWAFNILLAMLFIAPEILNSPEVLAIIPAEYQRWFLVAAFLVNIWMRPRPATVASDPEVQVKKTLQHVDGPAVVEVKAPDGVKARIHA